MIKYESDRVAKMFRCECHAHAVGVSAFRGERSIQIDWWCVFDPKPRFWTRLKKAWELFIEGAYLVNDVYLTLDQADEFVDAVIEAINIAATPERVITEDRVKEALDECAV